MSSPPPRSQSAARSPDRQTNIADRLRWAREQARLEPADLRARLRERGIDLSKTGLYRLETTEPKNPNLKQIEAIAEITRVSPGWLLFGKGAAVPADEAGAAIRERVIDTIELLAEALELNARQQQSLEKWLASVRKSARNK